MKRGLRFIGHLFYEDKRIPVGVAVAMMGGGIMHRILPLWANDLMYVVIIVLTLTVSVLSRG